MNNNNLKLSPKLLEMVEKCASSEELIKLAKENGVELSAGQAKNILDSFDRDLTDEELKAVAGGAGFLGWSSDSGCDGK